MRRVDFHSAKSTYLHSVTSLLEGLYRHRYIEEEINGDEGLEEDRQRWLTEIQCSRRDVNLENRTGETRAAFFSHKPTKGTDDGPSLPPILKSSCYNQKWEYVIDKEYDSLIRHETRICVPHTSNNLKLEGCDVYKAYIHDNFDIPIIMDQMKDSSGVIYAPDHV